MLSCLLIALRSINTIARHSALQWEILVVKEESEGRLGWSCISDLIFYFRPVKCSGKRVSSGHWHGHSCRARVSFLKTGETEGTKQTTSCKCKHKLFALLSVLQDTAVPQLLDSPHCRRARASSHLITLPPPFPSALFTATWHAITTHNAQWFCWRLPWCVDPDTPISPLDPHH